MFTIFKYTKTYKKVITFKETYTDKKIKSVSYYRDLVFKSIYDLRLQFSKIKLENVEGFYIIFDKSTDSCRNYILYLLIGECCIEKRIRPYFLGLVELEKIK